MRKIIRTALNILICCFLFACGTAPTVYFSANGKQLDALLCRPKGAGPFPAVVYNHGSIVDAVGLAGARARGNTLDTICLALAEEGFLTFVPIRERVPMGISYDYYQDYYKEIVSCAIDHVRAIPEVDASRVAVMGHSMGGLLTLLMGIERKDLKALVITAPATRDPFYDAVFHADQLNAPVLLLVETSDLYRHVLAVDALDESLKKYGKQVKTIRYSRGGGHQLFFKVDYYWSDVRAFLREKLATP